MSSTPSLMTADELFLLVADPRRRTITAYRAPGDVRIYDVDETVDASAAVAGWSLVVADAFS